jgi:hypothetical protein
MHKYIVKINFVNRQNSFVTLKAKNELNLNLTIAYALKEILGNLDNVESIDYERVKHFTFSKKGIHWFIGNTCVPVKCLEQLLNSFK